MFRKTHVNTVIELHSFHALCLLAAVIALQDIDIAWI